MARNRTKQSPKIRELMKRFRINSRPALPVKPKKLRTKRLSQKSTKTQRNNSKRRNTKKPSAKRNSNRVVKTIAQRIAALKKEVNNKNNKGKLSQNDRKVSYRKKTASKRARKHYNRYL